VIDCIERKTEKRHECANMAKVKTTRIMMATVPHVTSGSGLGKFQVDGFLLDRVYKWSGEKLPILEMHVLCKSLGSIRVTYSPETLLDGPPL
jgi:hypothetical protein